MRNVLHLRPVVFVAINPQEWLSLGTQKNCVNNFDKRQPLLQSQQNLLKVQKLMRDYRLSVTVVAMNKKVSELLFRAACSQIDLCLLLQFSA